MNRFLLLVAGICLSSSLWAATYTYTGTPYTGFGTFSPPCATGPCANYPAGSMVSGWFTTAAPLAGGLSGDDIYASVTGYSFTDGLNTYSSADQNARVYKFAVVTDASGNISSVDIELSVWMTGAAPHAVNDRESALTLFVSSGLIHVYNNRRCLQIGVANANVPDTCVSATEDASSSHGSGLYGSWSTAVTPVVGLWWNPNESGSGYNIDVKHGVLVITVYSYKPTGEQEWYITSGPIVNGSFTGTLDRYVGGQCISCAYNGLPVSAGNAGVVTINFTSPVSATMFLPGGRVTNIQPEAF